MMHRLVLASASQIRLDLLERAGLQPVVSPASLDEESPKRELQHLGKSQDQIAQHLAAAKARKVSESEPEAMVIGADQILVLDETILSKPTSPADAVSQLMRMQGRCHSLISAVAVFENGKPCWQTTDAVELDMRELSEAFVRRYVDEEWETIRYSVGCYAIEGRGIGLFKQVRGDYHTILGLPVFDLLTYLEKRGVFSL